MVHTVRHEKAATEAKDPEQTVTEPPRPAPQQWILYTVLAHAHTLAEHSIQPSKDITYVVRLLQDWLKYETEVLEGHTGPPDTTLRTTWDDLVPDADISALAKLIQNKAPKHLFNYSYDPAMVNTITTYHSWTTQQRLHLHSASNDPCEWHPIAPPALEVYLHDDAANGAHVITDLRPVTLQPISEPYIPPRPPRPCSPAKDNSPLRDQDPPAQKDAEPTITVQHMPNPLTTHHVTDNYQLPREG